MATKPVIFKFEDSSTGKIYQVEGDAGSTEAEAMSYLDTLSPEELGQYEFKPQASTPQTPAAPAPATQSVQDVFERGDDVALTPDFQDSPLADEDLQTYVDMARNPNIASSDIARFLSERGKIWTQQSEQELAAYRQAIAEGRETTTDVGYRSIVPDVLGPEVEMYDPDVGDWGAALEEGMAYNPMGVVTRLLQDWTDSDLQGGISKDSLRQQFPNLDDDSIENLHDSLIGELRRRELNNAGYQVEERDVNPGVRIAGNLLGSSSPVDIVPLGRGTTFGKRLLEGAVENVAADAAVQAGDVAYGAQDRYDFGQSLQAGIEGAALQGGIEGVVRGVTRLARGTPSTTAAAEPIAVPTSRSNSKKFKTELAETAVQANNYIHTITKDWKNAPEIEVHADFKKVDGVDDDAIGVYQADTGKVLINTAAAVKEAKRLKVDVEEVLNAVTYHESLGHYGLAQKFGDDLQATLHSFIEGADANLKGSLDRWLKQNPDAYAGSPYREALAMEEILAEMSEGGQIRQTFYDVIANKIKEFGRAMGLNLNFSHREVRAILAQAHKKVVGGDASPLAGSGNRYTTGDEPVDFTKIREGKISQRELDDYDRRNATVTYLHDMVKSGDTRVNEREVHLMRNDYQKAFDAIKNSDNPHEIKLAVKLSKTLDTLDDVINIVRNRDKGIANDNNRYMVTYHGSPHDFDAFDHSKMGSGEGAQVYGWGTYLTDTKDIAEGYKRRLSRLANPKIYGDVIDKYVLQSKKNPTPEEAHHRQEVLAWMGDFITFKLEGKKYKNGREAVEAMYRDPTNVDPVEAEEILSKVNWQQVDEAWNFVEKADIKPAKGRLYEVDVPDDAVWLDWDYQISDEVKDILSKKLGMKFQSKEELDKLVEQKKALEAKRNKVWQKEYNAQLELDAYHDEIVKDWEDNEDYINLKNEQGVATARDFAVWSAGVLDPSVKKRMSSLVDKRDAAREEYEEYWDKIQDVIDQMANDTTGEAVYRDLSSKLGSDEAASRALNDVGITGTRYLDGFSRNQGEGSFNYVVYSDKTPKILNKYMKPGRTTGIGKVNPDDLSPEELFEARNAYDILDNMTKDYEPVVFTMEDLTAEAEARGLTASDMLRRKEIEPGEWSRRLIMYDIAIDKLNTKLTDLYAKVQSGDASPAVRQEYADTLVRFQTLSSRIFGEQSEAGRALRTLQSLNYTKRRVEGLKATLEDVSAQGFEDLVNDPEFFNRFAKEVQDQLAEKSPKKSKLSGIWTNAINLPRAIMSSMDLSAPLRQGIFFIGKKEFWRAFPNMFKYAMSQQSYNDMMKEITRRPNYHRMVEANLPFSNAGGKINQREEDFMSDWAGKIPVLGIGVRASERAYTGFLNKVRADVFDSLVNDFEQAGVTINDKLLKDLGGFIGNATGRGSLNKKYNGAVPLLNTVFFSPRLIVARAQMLNPQYYATLHPSVRKEAIKSLLSFGSIALTVLTLASLSGADVETDPRSSDFGKIKAGNTRYDVLGGFAQYITLGARLILGEKLTATGEVSEYGNDYGEESRLDALANFGRNKLAPIASLWADYLDGQDAIGNDFNATTAVGSRLVPMYAQDTVEAIGEYGLAHGLAVSAPGLFGVATNTYTPYNLNPEEEVEAPESFTMKTLEDGANDQISVKNGVVTLSPEVQKQWQTKINEYVKLYMQEEISTPEWKTLTDKEKAEVIKDVRNDARKEAKKDMLEVLQLN